MCIFKEKTFWFEFHAFNCKGISCIISHKVHVLNNTISIVLSVLKLDVYTLYYQQFLWNFPDFEVNKTCRLS